MPKIILSETYTSFIDIMHLRYQFIHFFSDLVIFQLSHISFLMIVFRWPANNGQRTKDSNTIMITMDEQTNGQFIRKFSPNRLILVFHDVRWHYGSN